MSPLYNYIVNDVTIQKDIVYAVNDEWINR